MSDMNMELHTGSGKCLYEQIYEHIRKEIRTGKLLTGEKLPSTRSLAEYLQVSRSTVDYAYEQLLSEGYIEARPYRGYFVCRVEELFELEKEDQCQKSENEPPRKFESEEKLDCLCDFSPNGIDMSAFPLSVWNRISRNTLSEGQNQIFNSGDAQGEYELRQTISRYLHSSRGVNGTPEQIIIGAGNDYLLMLLEKILGRQVEIAMENPTYKRAWNIFQSFSYRITAVDMDEAGMKAEELHMKNVTAAYVMPSHQFPTGVVMPIGRRMELLKWAEEEPGRYLIEDDYDSEFRYRGKPIPSLQSADRSGKVIYIGTFSKSIAPAIRVGYMVLPQELLEVYRETCSYYSSTVSRIDQMILNEFIKDGYFERHLNKMRKVYRDKHDFMLAYLRPFREQFEISGENAGLHLLLHCKDQRTEEELVRAAAEKGVKVYGMSDYLVASDETESGKRGETFKGMKKAPWNEGATILLGYGGLSTEQMHTGMEQLKKAWL